MPFCKHKKAVKMLTLKITWCGFMLTALTKIMKGWVMLKLLGGQNSRQSDQMTAKQNWFKKCISSAHFECIEHLLHYVNKQSDNFFLLSSCSHTHKIGREKQSLKKSIIHCELLSTSSCMHVCVCVCVINVNAVKLSYIRKTARIIWVLKIMF